MGSLLWGTIRAGFWGLLLVPICAFAFVVALFIFDPKCGGPGDSGGCAMGLLTVPVAAALPGFMLGAGIGLARGLWRRRPDDWGLAIRRLRTWGRED